MQAMNLLVVERDADWTEWPAAMDSVGADVLVLVQQSDESCEAFRARIRDRAFRFANKPLRAVVLLPARTGSELTTNALMLVLTSVPTLRLMSAPLSPGHRT
jgi:hypothetical protein